jgi:transcriptional regulator with XRE-family HTH domain
MKEEKGTHWFTLSSEGEERRQVLGYTLMAIARRLPEIPYYWLRDRHTDGQLPSAQFRLFAREYWSAEQLPEFKSLWHNRHTQNAYTKAELAREAGVSRPTYNWYLQKGSIPEPDQGEVYSLKAAKAVLRFFDDLGRAKDRLSLLQPGLRELGLNAVEIGWCRLHPEVLPEPAMVVGKNKRNQYYSSKQLEQIAKRAKLRRGE